MKAYRITINGWDNLELILAAPTPGKAKYDQYLIVTDCGYNYQFTDFRAVRAKEFDHLAEKSTYIDLLGCKDRDGNRGCLMDATNE